MDESNRTYTDEEFWALITQRTTERFAEHQWEDVTDDDGRRVLRVKRDDKPAE